MKEEEFIKIMKNEGIETALSISAREENKGWLCPVCKSPVLISSQEQYETGEEHVIDPNRESYPKRDAYRCTNSDCVCNDEKHKVFWNYNGEMYGGFMIDDDDFIDQNNAPFGSFERKMNLEIHKCGVKDRIELSPALCLWFLQPYIQYHYKGNVMGNVVKRWFTIEFLKKDRDRNEYCYGFNFCWGTWSFLWREFKSKIIAYKEHKDANLLKTAFERTYNRSWEYIWFENTIKVLYWRYYKKIK